MHLYLRQPGYGARYLSRRASEGEDDRRAARQLGDGFTWQRVMGEINPTGMIPVLRIHWELTGDDHGMRELVEGRPLPPL